jgi:hypothetical protein
MNNNFYVYRWIRLDTNTPFYIGKGKGNRYLQYKSRNARFKRIYTSTSTEVEIMIDNLTEEQAFSKEIEFIKLYKSLGYCEANLTEGGTGGDTSKYKEKHVRAKNVICLNDNLEYIDVYKAAEYYKMDSKEIKISCYSKIHLPCKNGKIFVFKEKIYKERKISVIRPLKIISSDGKEYKNCIEAAKILNLNYKSLLAHIEGRSSAILINRKLITFWKENELPKNVPSLWDWNGKKKIKCLNNNEIYESARDASRKLGIDYKHISTVCKGKRPTTYGYKFEYIL